MFSFINIHLSYPVGVIPTKKTEKDGTQKLFPDSTLCFGDADEQLRPPALPDAIHAAGEDRLQGAPPALP